MTWLAASVVRMQPLPPITTSSLAHASMNQIDDGIISGVMYLNKVKS